MSDKNNVVESFIESHNMDYLFLLLANLEVKRLEDLPYTVKKSFAKKITEVALEHVAKNDIPDYIVEQADLLDNEEQND